MKFQPQQTQNFIAAKLNGFTVVAAILSQGPEDTVDAIWSLMKIFLQKYERYFKTLENLR